MNIVGTRLETPVFTGRRESSCVSSSEKTSTLVLGQPGTPISIYDAILPVLDADIEPKPVVLNLYEILDFSGLTEKSEEDHCQFENLVHNDTPLLGEVKCEGSLNSTQHSVHIIHKVEESLHDVYS